MVKNLIIGKGFLGNVIQSLEEEQKNESKITYYKENGIDVTKSASIERVFNREKPEVVINCAAVSDLDAIELDPKNAFNVNAKGAEEVAKICKRDKIKLIHISTDSVFDGKKGMYHENDIPNPINEYAKSKKLGEDLIRKISEEHVIVRTNFYGNDISGNNLFDWVIKKLKTNSKIIGFNDVIFNPLEVRNLSQLILDLSQTNFSGLIHLASDKSLSKYEFCLTIAEKLGFSQELIQKGSINDIRFQALRPFNTTLSNKLSTKILKTKLISLEDYLDEYKKS